MSRHRFKRTLSDADLLEKSDDELWEFAGQCDVEPADESVCDACAAMMLVQDRQDAAKKVVSDDDREALIQEANAVLSMWRDSEYVGGQALADKVIAYFEKHP